MRNQVRPPPKYTICCRECKEVLTEYGVQSTLLSNPNVFLLSTNIISSKINPVYNSYSSRTCKCVVKDVGCANCGKIVGYHIIQPCSRCLRAQNNGHMWMFHFECVSTANSENILIRRGNK